MKNEYEVRGDVTAIFLNRRDGSVIETLIDTADLSMVQSFVGAWHANWNQKTRKFRARGGWGTSAIYLHRFIMVPPDDLVVDHRNHDSLDNRRSNLRCVTNSVNMLNRSGPRPGSRSGVRGVSFDSGKWRAEVNVFDMKFRGKPRSSIEEAARDVPALLEIATS